MSLRAENIHGVSGVAAVTRPRPAFKVWLETEEGYVFGPGVYSLLRKVKDTGTLKEAAESLDMSYRYAWGLVKKAEETLGQKLLEAHKGGRDGGGGAELTEVGQQFLEEFSRIEAVVSKISNEGWRMDESGTKTLVEGLVAEVDVKEERVEITLKLVEPALLKLSVLNEMITEEITPGDSLSVQLNFYVSSITKGDRR